jgi:hypothetical protein
MKMKTVLVWLFIVFSTVGCLAQTNGISDSKPLELNLKIDKSKPCIGKDFKIVARLVNVSEKNVMIDNRNLWRSVILKAVDAKQNNESSNDDKMSFPDLLRKGMPRYQVSFGDSFEDTEVPTKYLVSLKPKEYYEDSILIKSNDDFFQKSGKYYVKSEYRQYKDWSSKNVILFIGDIESNELEFELNNCK